MGARPTLNISLACATINGGVKTLLNIEKIFLEDGPVSLNAMSKQNNQPNPSSVPMNNWTISRRIIAGFFTLVVFAVALGVFALWRLTGLAQDIGVSGGQQYSQCVDA